MRCPRGMELERHQLANPSLAMKAPADVHDARLPQSDPDEDGLRKNVYRTMDLTGKTEVDEKKRQNKMAIGGMRQPRMSIKKVPGHLIIGPKIHDAIDHYFRDHPHTEATIAAAIGARKEELVKPSEE